MGPDERLAWLRESDASRLEELWRRADAARRRAVGDEVHLRGLVEISNHCVRRCTYCGLRGPNAALSRYRMTAEEIVASVQDAARLGYGTAVLQSGEDPGVTAESMAEVIRRIKAETSLAVTLSLGERADRELALWRQAGADRYLLRFETSNRELYDRIHPPRDGVRSDRVAMLRRLREMGYEIGGGVMIGIPGQSYEDLARDVEVLAELELDMIGVGPYIAHPATPLGRKSDVSSSATAAHTGNDARNTEQVPATELMTYKMIALARLACPWANIPSTTALATVNRAAGRELGLARGANVVMPNVTPRKYRALYEIYPSKACVDERPQECGACLRRRIEGLGRKVGTGRGDSRHRTFSPAAE